MIARMLLERLVVTADVQRAATRFRGVRHRVTGAGNGPGDAVSEAGLRDAEAFAATEAERAGARHRLAGRLPRLRCQAAADGLSVDALWKRAPAGALPRVNWLVDLYNAISVRHVLPVGGEDLGRYSGPIRLIRAAGDEPFDTVASGEAVVEHPAPGEVVWTDDLGVTCRRWNWRQGTRTRLTEASTDILFLLERLEPLPLADLDAAGDALVAAVVARYPNTVAERRRIGPGVEVSR